MVKAFCYGILKTNGRASHHALCSHVEEAHLAGYKMYSVGSFPAVVKTGDSKDVVHGEVHTYPDESIFTENFDHIEGYNPESHTGMYLREVTEPLNSEGDSIEGLIQMYLWNRDTSNLEPVESGVW